LLSKSGHTDDTEPLFKRAIVIGKKALGLGHPLISRSAIAIIACACFSRAAEVLSRVQAGLAKHETTLGPNHAWTEDSPHVTAHVAFWHIKAAKIIAPRRR